MRRKLLLLTILLLPFLPVRIQAEGSDRYDIHIRIAMGRYTSQEMTTIRITLRLPKETDNAYSIREAAVDVELTALTIQESVATGDQTQRTLLISSILAVISFLIIIVRRRRKDHEEAR